MKVTGPGPINPTRSRRNRTTRDAKGSEFSNQIAEDVSPTGQLAGAAPVSAIEGILAAQEVSDANSGRSRGVVRGHDLLDRLDEIRHGLLTGAISRSQLVALREQVRSKREHVTDARLTAILDEIDLRVAVELAKLGIMR